MESCDPAVRHRRAPSWARQRTAMESCDPAVDEEVAFLGPSRPFSIVATPRHFSFRRIMAAVIVSGFVGALSYVCLIGRHKFISVDELISKYNLTRSALDCGGQMPPLKQEDPPWNRDEGLAVLCCIALNEGPYIGEFADYHLGLGFGKIVVYDNSDSFELEQWGRTASYEYNGRVEVIHFPGPGKQGNAYLDCAKKASNGTFGNKIWAAFLDIDEFLVLKRHENIEALLEEHLVEGSLSVNWIQFAPCGKLFCEPLPVTKRFVYHEPETNRHVKTIVRLEDMNMTRLPHPHFPYLKNGNQAYQHDTNNKILNGPSRAGELAFNEDGPTDVAVIHHYHKKSYGEYVMKRHRGRADTTDKTDYEKRIHAAIRLFEEALEKNSTVNHMEEMAGLTFDDSAWTMLKKVSPKYAVYDQSD